MVLKGIGHVASEQADRGRALVVQPGVAQGAVEKAVVGLVVAELHVPAQVPREPRLVARAAGQPAGLIVLLDDHHVVVAVGHERQRGAETRGAGADDHDASWVACAGLVGGGGGTHVSESLMMSDAQCLMGRGWRGY